VIAVLTLPVTALSSVVGMNVIVKGRTLWIPLAIGGAHPQRQTLVSDVAVWRDVKRSRSRVPGVASGRLG
jgi:hypothetical protein